MPFTTMDPEMRLVENIHAALVVVCRARPRGAAVVGLVVPEMAGLCGALAVAFDLYYCQSSLGDGSEDVTGMSERGGGWRGM